MNLKCALTLLASPVLVAVCSSQAQISSLTIPMYIRLDTPYPDMGNAYYHVDAANNLYIFNTGGQISKISPSGKRLWVTYVGVNVTQMSVRPNGQIVGYGFNGNGSRMMVIHPTTGALVETHDLNVFGKLAGNVVVTLEPEAAGYENRSFRMRAYDVFTGIEVWSHLFLEEYANPWYPGRNLHCQV